MHTFASPNFNRALHARFAGARTAAGALKFPAFLMVWSIGVALVAGIYFPADALVRQAPLEFPELQSLTSVDDDSAFSLALEVRLRESTVMAGDWQPQVLVPMPPETHQTPELEVKRQPITIPTINPQLQLEAPRMTKTPVVKVDAGTTKFDKPAATGSADNPRSVVQQVLPSGRTILLKRDARRSLAAGENRVAYRDLMAGLSEGARDSGYLGLLALAALASGHPSEARLVYQRLLVMEPDNEQWWAGLAISSERLGLEAASVYLEALARSGEDSKIQVLVQTRLQGLG